MREIKFRMFDTLEKNFMNGSRVIESRINDLNKGGRFIYQQWTGLKDKNGKEIYEGDILQDENQIGVVKWVPEHCAFLVYVSKPAGYHYLESDGLLKHTAVIGNIYENPELLEEGK